MSPNEFTLFVTAEDADKGIENSQERASTFSDEAQSVLQRRAPQGDATMILDFSELADNAAISSSFIGRIVSLRKQFMAQCPKGVFRLTAVPDNVCEQLQITNLTTIIEIFNRSGERVTGKSGNGRAGKAEVSSGVSSDSHTL